MESKITVEHTKIPGNECLILRTQGYNTATINGIRRSLLSEVPTFGFVEELDPEDYKIVTGTKEDRRNTALVCTLSQSIPVMAHRCSRLSIHTDEVTRPLLTSDSDRHVYFVICQKPESSDEDLKSLMTRPLVVDTLSQLVHSRDLRPVVLLKVQDEDDEDPRYVYSKEESDAVLAEISRIFPYNELIATINHGQKLNVILKPVMGTGSQNVRWSPCTFRYHFMMDPAWKDLGEGVIIDGQVRRKIEGNRSLRHLFTHIPPTDGNTNPNLDRAYNRFGKPYGHTLVLQYNGKMNQVTAFQESIIVIMNAVDLFLSHYMKADTEGAMMSKETSTVSSEDGSLNSNLELLYIPKNTQDKLPEKDYILTDHTIGNIITTKMLEIIDQRIEQGKLGDDTWSQTHIAYKIPHPLVKQCLMTLKIPETLELTHEDLIRRAVEEIKMDLNNLLLSVAGDVEDI